jgi:hypothetical protein
MITIKFNGEEYTLHDELDKCCENCHNEGERQRFVDEDYNDSGWLIFPNYHSCEGCIEFSKWSPTKRHLYQIIEYLQKKKEH